MIPIIQKEFRKNFQLINASIPYLERPRLQQTLWSKNTAVTLVWRHAALEEDASLDLRTQESNYMVF